MIINYQILDSVLNYLKDSTEEFPKHEDQIFEIFDINLRDKKIILQKLVDDGYIQTLFFNGSQTYYISFNGILLIDEEGGYSGRLKREKDLVSFNQKILIQNRNFTQIIAWATVLSTLFSCISLINSCNQKPIKIQIDDGKNHNVNQRPM